MNEGKKDNKTAKALKVALPEGEHSKGEPLLMVSREDGSVTQLAEVVTEDQESAHMEIVQKSLAKMRFVVIFQDRYTEIITTLPHTSVRILSYMMANMKVGNRVYDMAYSDITSALHMSVMTVSRGINSLIDNKILAKTMTRNRPVYFIDPSLCYKGKLHSHKRILEDYARITNP